MQEVVVPTDSTPRSGLRQYLTDGIKSLLKNAASKLKGSARRRFMSETVLEFGPGGQCLAERDLGWNRGTIRKGLHELSAGIECKDAFCMRGRKGSEKHLPNLHDDIREIVEPGVHVDATLRTSRLYTKLTARQVRIQLIEKKTTRMKIFPSGEP